MKTNSELLLGTWIGDSEDVESIQQFGNVKLHFTADGKLIYTIFDEHKDQKMFLTYRVENNILITDQASAPLPMMANLNGNVLMEEKRGMYVFNYQNICFSEFYFSCIHPFKLLH